MPVSAPISRKLKPPKPPACMRRSAASKMADLISLISVSGVYLSIDSKFGSRLQRRTNGPPASLRVLAEAGGALDVSCSGARRLTLGVQSVSRRADHYPERPLLDLHPRKSVEQR